MEPSLRADPTIRSICLAEVTASLHADIPMTASMGMVVSRWDGHELALTAPLEPSRNHADTAFGGSISSLSIMAGYTLLHILCLERAISTRILIQKSQTEYLRPIDADMTATAHCPEPVALTELVEALQRKRRARITLETQVLCHKVVAARHTGLYVAMLY